MKKILFYIFLSGVFSAEEESGFYIRGMEEVGKIVTAFKDFPIGKKSVQQVSDLNVKPEQAALLKKLLGINALVRRETEAIQQLLTEKGFGESFDQIDPISDKFMRSVIDNYALYATAKASEILEFVPSINGMQILENLDFQKHTTQTLSENYQKIMDYNGSIVRSLESLQTNPDPEKAQRFLASYSHVEAVAQGPLQAHSKIILALLNGASFYHEAFCLLHNNSLKGGSLPLQKFTTENIYFFVANLLQRAGWNMRGLQVCFAHHISKVDVDVSHDQKMFIKILLEENTKYLVKEA